MPRPRITARRARERENLCVWCVCVCECRCISWRTTHHRNAPADVVLGRAPQHAVQQRRQLVLGHRALVRPPAGHGAALLLLPPRAATLPAHTPIAATTAAQSGEPAAAGRGRGLDLTPRQTALALRERGLQSVALVAAEPVVEPAPPARLDGHQGARHHHLQLGLGRFEGRELGRGEGLDGLHLHLEVRRVPAARKGGVQRRACVTRWERI